MFFLPKLSILEQKTKTIRSFKGLNTHDAIPDEALADCVNLSSREFPALTVCNPWQLVDGYGPTIYDYQIIGLDGCLIEIKKGEPWQILIHTSDQNWKSVVPIALAAGEQILEAAEFQGGIVLLTVINGCYYLKKLLFNGQIAINTELTNLMEGADPIFGGLVSHAHRLIIAQDNRLHISYYNSLTRWEDYLVNDQLTPQVAQQYTLDHGGPFIAGISYKNGPVFFKRRAMYAIYGESAPFELVKLADVGCINPKSAAVCDGVLYFLSENGVMAYSGGLPKLVSQDCPELPERLQESTACSDGQHYYLGNYAYDPSRQAWMKLRENASDGDITDAACHFMDQTYFIKRTTTPTGSRTHILYRYDTDRFDPTLAAEDWSFTTKEFHEEEPMKKQLSRLAVRLEPKQEATVTIDLAADGGAWQTLFTGSLSAAASKEIVLKTPPCHSFRFRISGTGKVTIPWYRFIYRNIPDGKIHPF